MSLLRDWFNLIHTHLVAGTLPAVPTATTGPVTIAPTAPPATGLPAGIAAISGRFCQPTCAIGTPYAAWWHQIQGIVPDTDDAVADWNLNFGVNQQLLQVDNNSPVDNRWLTEAHDFAAPKLPSGNAPVLPGAIVWTRANLSWPGVTLDAFAAIVEANKASGNWNLPDHSNHGFGIGS